MLSSRLLPALFLLALLIPSVLGAEKDPKAELSITAPLDYQVIQRQTATAGKIAVRGRAPGEAAQVRVRITGKGLRGEVPEVWQKVAVAPDTRDFSGQLAAPAGGWYQIEVQVPGGVSKIVPHVGVGEVFVIAGQSNSTNYGEQKTQTKTGMVASFDGSTWQLANDPQPGIKDGSTLGSFMPTFGDAMFDKYKVPIGVAATGYGATSVRQWLPAGSKIKIPPTWDGFTKQIGPQEWECDGTLFDGLVTRIKALGSGGYRAVLWHQGESDSHQKAGHDITGEAYGQMLSGLIADVKKQTGSTSPWFVAQASYHTPDDPSCPEIRAAQTALWDAGVALPGPDTDTLTADYRDNGGKGVHLNLKGLEVHGKLWAKSVGAYLDKALVEK